MADADKVKQIRIKTGVLKRMAKEKASYEKEVEKQTAKVEQMKTDSTKDEHDIRKQEEVLQESVMMIPDCQRRLVAAWDDLSKLVQSEGSLAESEEYKNAQAMLQETQAVAQR